MELNRKIHQLYAASYPYPITSQRYAGHGIFDFTEAAFVRYFFAEWVLLFLRSMSPGFYSTAHPDGEKQQYDPADQGKNACHGQ